MNVSVLWLTSPFQSLKFNVPGGKLNRGLSVVDTAEIIKGSELTEDEYFKAAILGWSVELVGPSIAAHIPPAACQSELE